MKTLEEIKNERGWVLTSERLPKNGEKVLYVTKDGMVQGGIYYNDNTALNFEWYEFVEELFSNDSDVIAWKPYN